jgi:xanthine phosphoribosyltransferase
MIEKYQFSAFQKDLKSLNIKNVDAIVAIARGGFTFAHFIAQKENIRNLLSINSIHYDDNQKLDSIEIFNIPNLDKYNTILIVDDISDSGDTLTHIIKLLKERYPNKTFKTATIFYKETSGFKPDFYLRKTENWIEFFWD